MRDLVVSPSLEKSRRLSSRMPSIMAHTFSSSAPFLFTWLCTLNGTSHGLYNTDNFPKVLLKCHKALNFNRVSIHQVWATDHRYNCSQHMGFVPACVAVGLRPGWDPPLVLGGLASGSHADQDLLQSSKAHDGEGRFGGELGGCHGGESNRCSYTVNKGVLMGCV